MKRPQNLLEEILEWAFGMEVPQCSLIVTSGEKL